MHCIDPASINKNCPASQEWIPNTPPLTQALLFKPLQHPFPECPFYRFGYQNFLIATQPDPTSGEAPITTYPTIDDAFTKTTPLAAGALAAPGTHRGTALRSWLGDIRQAGGRQIVVDQNGHTLYYGIHMNQAFVDFINSQQVTLPGDAGSTSLATLEGVRNADPNLFLPAGLVEFKTAWMDIDPQDGIAPADNANFVANFVTTMAWLPTLSRDPRGFIAEDRNHPRQRQMALVAMHVVYTIPGHPEFVWGSFQHIDANGNPDTAGVAAAHPPATSITGIQDPNEDVCPVDAGPTSYLLCKPDTLAQQANTPIPEQTFTLGGADGQTFLVKGQPAQTSIYRVFPGSKSNSDQADDDVVSLNTNIDAAWAQAQIENTVDPNDRRMHYHLVGANWMDKPAVFGLNRPFQNGVPDPTSSLQSYVDPLLSSGDGGVPPGPIEQADERAALWTMGGLTVAVDDLVTNGTDSPFSILGGEERMSSTAMESYSQTPSSFFNCFQCHNTQAVSVFGIPTVKDPSPTVITLLDPKLINVSHLFSQFVLEECTQFGQQLIPDGGAPAACPR
jgi:hypothetical protein